MTRDVGPGPGGGPFWPQGSTSDPRLDFTGSCINIDLFIPSKSQSLFSPLWATVATQGCASWKTSENYESCLINFQSTMIKSSSNEPQSSSRERVAAGVTHQYPNRLSLQPWVSLGTVTCRELLRSYRPQPSVGHT